MEKLEDAQESLFFPSCGTQAEAMKKTSPSWSLPRAARDTEKKVFISNRHPQDLLGKDSPAFAYSPKRQRHLPQWGFGTAAARPALAKPKYPEASNDLIGTTPDSQQLKYCSKKAVILRSSRDAAYYAPDFDGFPAGAISPGPQRYTPAASMPGHRFSHAPEVDRIPPKYTMRPMTKPPTQDSQTPARVGPGLYYVEEACAPQAKSEKPSKPQWSVNRTERFAKRAEKKEAGRLWDGLGDRARQFNRTYSSSPSFSFGTSTRGHQKKVAPARTQLDKGPSARMDKPWQSHPTLPLHKEVMRYSDVPTG
mmetsp:Transcript_117575/g.379470  ORF Transcript_117575/g.379470 Transcript_117575/m.379470 type:complete len:308 (-) Transcript_117575:240-1163(-)